jgi:hypothetical protein
MGSRRPGQQSQQQLDSIRRGCAEINAGHYVPHSAMKAWLLSLGSNRELATPKCVCGRLHMKMVKTGINV